MSPLPRIRHRSSPLHPARQPQQPRQDAPCQRGLPPPRRSRSAAEHCSGTSRSCARERLRWQVPLLLHQRSHEPQSLQHLHRCDSCSPKKRLSARRRASPKLPATPRRLLLSRGRSSRSPQSPLKRHSRPPAQQLHCKRSQRLASRVRPPRVRSACSAHRRRRSPARLRRRRPRRRNNRPESVRNSSIFHNRSRCERRRASLFGPLDRRRPALRLGMQRRPFEKLHGLLWTAVLRIDEVKVPKLDVFDVHGVEFL